MGASPMKKPATFCEMYSMLGRSPATVLAGVGFGAPGDGLEEAMEAVSEMLVSWVAIVSDLSTWKAGKYGQWMCRRAVTMEGLTGDAVAGRVVRHDDAV